MIIYGEYLFIENFITGVILLFFTAKILELEKKTIRFLLCGICCGLYSFILFTDVNGILSLFGKCLFAVLMVRIAFGGGPWKKSLKQGMAFLGLTILYGGIAIAILTSFGWTGVTAAAGVYLPPLTYTMITIAAAAASLFLHYLLFLLKVKRMEKRMTAEAEIKIEDKSWIVRGLIDSGNGLKEPLTGKPVCVIRSSLAENIRREILYPDIRYTVIPYRAIGTEHGILEGYRVDEIQAAGKKLKGAILAICEEDNMFTEEKEIQILLPASLLERGIYGDFE